MDQSGTNGITFSTHVLDVSRGVGAAEVRVELHGEGSCLGSKLTDASGRIGHLTDLPVRPGSYTLTAYLGEYFGSRPHLLGKVSLELELSESRHYHVPLLIGPYLLSSYRGT